MNHTVSIYFLWISLVMAGVGCASVGPAQAPEGEKEVAEVPSNLQPPPSSPSAPSAPCLAPGLMVQVSVLVSGKKEIDEPNKRVSNSGEITLPLVGSVMAKDLALDDFERKLRGLYARYYVDPQVVVEFVKEQDSALISPWGFVTVLGRVKTPGRVNIPPTQDLSVSSAVQLAGGLDTSARDTAIRVTRRTNGGEAEQFEVNLRAVGSKGRTQEDLLLKPGDVVFVPEMMF